MGTALVAGLRGGAALPLLWVCALGVASCGDDPMEALLVCGDLDVPTQLDALRVSLVDDAQEVRFTGLVALAECAPERLRQLPVNVELPLVEAPRWLRVQGLLDGVEAVRVELPVAVNGRRDLLTVNLTERCLGVTCALGQTCVDGSCVVAPEASDPRIRCDTRVSNAQPLGGADAGASDVTGDVGGGDAGRCGAVGPVP